MRRTRDARRVSYRDRPRRVCRRVRHTASCADRDGHSDTHRVARRLAGLARRAAGRRALLCVERLREMRCYRRLDGACGGQRLVERASLTQRLHVSTASQRDSTPPHDRTGSPPSIALVSTVRVRVRAISTSAWYRSASSWRRVRRSCQETSTPPVSSCAATKARLRAYHLHLHFGLGLLREVLNQDTDEQVEQHDCVRKNMLARAHIARLHARDVHRPTMINTMKNSWAATDVRAETMNARSL